MIKSNEKAVTMQTVKIVCYNRIVCIKCTIITTSKYLLKLKPYFVAQTNRF